MKIEALVIAFAALFFNVAASAAQERIVVGGSGSLNEEITQLAKAYAAKFPNEVVDVRPESMSTEGGLEGVRAGRLQIGLISRPLNPSEKGKLSYIGVARSMVGVVVHKSLPVSNLSEAHICDIFAGRIKSWGDVGGGADAKIMVLTRKRDDNNTQTFREKMPCFKALVITAEAIALVRGSEVLDALDKRPGTVGITNLGSSFKERDSIRAVAINGVIPATENGRNEKYRFFHEHGLVTLGEPLGVAKRFIEYMSTVEGRKIIGAHGSIPLR